MNSQKDTIMLSRTPLEIALKTTEKILKSSQKSKSKVLEKGNTGFKTYLKNCCGYNCNLEILKTNLQGFTCSKLLGEGTFGATFLFTNSKNEKIALKVIEYHDKNYVSQNEEKILKLLKNSCAIKRVLCYKNKFSEGNSTFLITEYIEGKNLNNIKLSNINIYKIIGQLIDSIEYIHSKNIVHFDIKPENIMITSDNNLKLIDFGGASLKDNNDYVTLSVSTQYYAPKTTDRTLPFLMGTIFDWFTFMTTIIKVLKHSEYVPDDLKYLSKMSKKDLKFDYTIIEEVDKIKKIIYSHTNSISKTSTNSKFHYSFRNLLNKI